jgi:hypothetical protein
MDAPPRRLRRTPPRILRNTDGDSYAIEAQQEAPPPDDFDPGYAGLPLVEYDDGNGLYIAQPEFSDTPIYLSTISARLEYQWCTSKR